MNQICPAQGHPCQHPRLCDGYCDINTAEVETPRIASLAARANERIRQLEAEKLALSNPGYPYAFLDAPGNWLDDLLSWFGALPWWKQVGVASGAVLACCFTAGVVVGFAK